MRFALLPLLMLTACSADVAPPAEAAPSMPAEVLAPQGASAAVYYCPDASEIFALFAEDSLGASSVALAIGDERIRMRQVEAASGTKYADSVGTTTLWNKGEEVVLDRSGTSQTCTTTNPNPAPPTGAHGATP